VQLPDYWLSRPAQDPGPDLQAVFDAAWQRMLQAGESAVPEASLPAPKWQFLCHLADAHGLVLHGSGDPNIELFEPRKASDLTDFGAQTAVYGAGDGIWAMFFAIADRGRIPSVTNACVRLADRSGQVGPPLYVFSISRSALPQQPWRHGSVYVLPGETFALQPPLAFGEYEVRVPQLASLVPVRPLARVAVAPEDFPFLAQVRMHDDDRLAEYAHALETGAPWPE